MANIRINRLRVLVGHFRPFFHVVENARSCTYGAPLRARFARTGASLRFALRIAKQVGFKEE